MLRRPVAHEVFGDHCNSKESGPLYLCETILIVKATFGTGPQGSSGRHPCGSASFHACMCAGA